MINNLSATKEKLSEDEKKILAMMSNAKRASLDIGFEQRELENELKALKNKNALLSSRKAAQQKEMDGCKKMYEQTKADRTKVQRELQQAVANREELFDGLDSKELGLLMAYIQKRKSEGGESMNKRRQTETSSS